MDFTTERNNGDFRGVLLGSQFYCPLALIYLGKKLSSQGRYDTWYEINVLFLLLL